VLYLLTLATSRLRSATGASDHLVDGITIGA